MTNEKYPDINLNEELNNKNLSLLIDIIHKFSQDIIAAKSEKDIFQILSHDVAKHMSFVDCVVYKVDSEEKVLQQVAAFGDAKLEKGKINNPLKLKFGEGHAGIVAKKGETLLISDVSKSPNYFFDVFQAGSELAVPVKIHNKVYAVISSEHPDKNFYKKEHVKLWEVVTSIAAGVLVKIQEKEELEKIKGKLEAVVERKSSDLDKAIETLSAQYSEMKHQHDKQETLIQEVHHRVTNNLQIISSILRLYINRDTVNTTEAMQEIYNRVQVMALIHQNIYKSMEMNLVNINSYLNDLLSYLKSTSKNENIYSSLKVEAEHFSLDVLVPLGLYITEVFYFWIDRAEKGRLKEIDFSIKLIRSDIDYSFEIIIKDNAKTPLTEVIDINSSEEMNYILISALIDQLEGELSQGFEKGNFIKLRFNTLS
jgi:two-component sensor histidine kinase